MLSLARINVFPIKALDPIEVSAARIAPSGALAFDRRFAIVDSAGQWINGKRAERIHQVRSRFDLETRTVTLRTEGAIEERAYSLDADRSALNEWLSDFFGMRAMVVENADAGFPDDTDSPGPTVASVASLQAVADWFPPLSVDEVRRRFRANLEIAGFEPFGEDRLVPPKGVAVRFRIGDVLFEGVNPCQRCVVPTRSPESGERWPGFTQRFSERRRASFPGLAPLERFDHFYRFAVNTRVPAGQAGKMIRVGDPVEIID